MKGFSLVELLIALFVFSLLSTFSFGAANMLAKSQQLLLEEADSIEEIQKVLGLLVRDLRQSVHFSSLPSTDLLQGNTFVLVKSGASDSVSYSLKEGVLSRELPLDNELLSRGSTAVLLSDIEVFSITSLGDVQSQIDQEDGMQSLFPGVNVSLIHKNFGSVSLSMYAGIREVDKSSSVVWLDQSDGSTDQHVQVESVQPNTSEVTGINPTGMDVMLPVSMQPNLSN